MTTCKKTLIASALILGFSSMANAATATAVWTGEVPGSSPDEKIVITGLDGSTAPLVGAVFAEPDGTLTTSAIKMESRNYTGSAEDPIPGDLVDANWEVASAQITYDGRLVDGATLEVFIDGTSTAIGTEIPGTNSIETQLKQTAELPVSEVAETTVQASLTMMASSL
ncbi:hypothetical protein [Vibrio kanaloae]|uniref:Uncharacterized protein n=1 Tax=Vibrio kanaloae TaxID=170673 RepID=A0A4U1WAA3_9VIBR|nr:hypothetical protein [Vibrio kanaloae]TKE89620.1 hypothetical protein FCV44_21365 [Vibrio kanaloae]TKF12468.1 hypothetical protein FCV47_20825 [Vibrio kanaloae]TKF23661.1 hypothetical protein FCV52_17365 [Vibrio kanaloae]